MADNYSGFEVVQAPARDDYSGFETVSEDSAVARAVRGAKDDNIYGQVVADNLVGRDRRFAPIVRRLPPETDPSISAVTDTTQRLSRGAISGTGRAIQGLARLIDLPTPANEAEDRLRRAFGVEIPLNRNPIGSAVGNVGRAVESVGMDPLNNYIDPARDQTLTARGADLVGSLAPIVVSGGTAAPLVGGLMMTEGGAREAEATGRPVDRAVVTNFLGGTALNLLPGAIATRGNIIRRAATGAVTGAGINAGGDALLQLADTGRIDPRRTLENAVIGGGVGLVTGAAARPRSRPSITQTLTPEAALELAADTAPTTVLELQGPPRPAEASARTLEDALAAQEALRQSPEGLQLLNQQLEEQAAVAAQQRDLRNRQIIEGVRAEEAAVPPVQETAPSPAELSARAFEEAAARDEAIRQSPAGARALQLDLAAREAAALDEARAAQAAETEAAATQAAAGRRIDADQFAAQREARARSEVIAQRQAEAEAAAAARRQAANEFAVQREGLSLDTPRPGQLELDLGETPTVRPSSQALGATAPVEGAPRTLTEAFVRPISSATGGALIGGQIGDTEEERRRNAIIGAGLGLGLRYGSIGLQRGAARLGEVIGNRQLRALPEGTRVTVQEYLGADGNPVKQFQIDVPDASAPRGSRSAEVNDLRAEGYYVPDFNSLDQGTYRVPAVRSAEPAILAQSFGGDVYAAQERPVEQNNPGQYQEADTRGLPPETVRGDSLEQGREVTPEGGTPPPEYVELVLPEQSGFSENVRRNLSDLVTQIGRGTDKYLGTTATRLRNIAQEVYGAAKRYEFNVKETSTRLKNEIIPFLEDARRILGTGDDRRQMTVHLNNGDFTKAAGLLANRVQRRANTDIEAALARLPASAAPEVRQQTAAGIQALYDNQLAGVLENFSRAQAANKDILDTARAAGIDTGELDNYWHRAIDPKRKKQFLEKIGRLEGPLSKAVSDYAEKLGMDPKVLSPDERADIINLVLRGAAGSDGGIPGQFKARGIENIQDLETYYLPYDQSALSYVDSSVRAIERRKLFGRAEDGNKGSLGHAIERANQDGRLSVEDEGIVQDLVRSRFNGGEQPSGKITNFIKSVANAAYLGQILDASTQMADFVMAPARYGVRDFVGAIVNPNEITAKGLGIEKVGQEFTNPGKVSKALDTLFTLTGFKKVVEAAQNANLNTSLRALRRKANTPKGLREIESKYARVMGDQYGQFIDDLQNGRNTENTRYAAYLELSDVQPLDLLEMPQAYLDNPNGRIFYALKTFTIKQFDAFRRNAIGQILEGRKNIGAGNKELGREQIGRGVKNMLTLAAAFTLGGAGVDAVKDLILGRDINLKDYATTGVLRLGGLNRYDYFNLKRNGLGTTIADKIAPPWGLLNEASKAVTSGDAHIVQRIPFIGDLLFEHTATGRKRAENDRRRRASEQRQDLLTEIQKRAAERRKATQQQRRERRLELQENRRR